MISAYLVVGIYAMSIIFYYLSLLGKEAPPFDFDSAVDDSKHCILARGGKKKLTRHQGSRTLRLYLRTASASVCTCPLLRCTYWCVYACSTLASTFVKHVLLFLGFPAISPCQSGKNLHAFKLHCGLFVQFLDLSECNFL
jgi:hypothetical protein